MKQKKNGLIGCLLVFTGLMAACTELEESSSSMQEKISITGTLDGFSALHSTRTQVGGMTENGALFMEWSVGDRVGVFGDHTVNAVFTGNHSSPAAQTTFQVV